MKEKEEIIAMSTETLAAVIENAVKKIKICECKDIMQSL